MTATRTTLRFVAAVAVSAAAGAGCTTGQAGTPAAESARETRAAATSPAAVTESPSQSPSPTGDAADSGGNEQPIAEPRDASISGGKARFEVLSLARQGGFLRLTARVTSVQPHKDAEWFPVYTMFGDLGESTARRFELIDAKHKKRYLVAQDSEKNCVCTRNLNAMLLLPGESALIEATFAEPPADVTTIDVVIPGPVGTFDDVPIS